MNDFNFTIRPAFYNTENRVSRFILNLCVHLFPYMKLFHLLFHLLDVFVTFFPFYYATISASMFRVIFLFFLLIIFISLLFSVFIIMSYPLNRILDFYRIN